MTGVGLEGVYVDDVFWGQHGCYSRGSRTSRHLTSQLLIKTSPPTSRAPGIAEAIDKAFRFRLAFLGRLNEIKRVHGDQSVLDVPQARHYQPAAEHLGLAIFGDLIKDYYERLVYEATRSPTTQKLPLLLERRQRSLDAGVNVTAVAGVATKVSTSDGVGRLSSELPAYWEVTFIR
eukprot:jgi/Tetstr1/434513/TSEL_023605.t1